MNETCYPLPMPPFWLGMTLFGLSLFAAGLSCEWFIRSLWSAWKARRQ